MAVPLKEQRILFQKSGNRCAFPDCRRVLTADASPIDGPVVLGDIAHIVAESHNGPRGNHPLSPEERSQYNNLILLCTQHHQLIDAQPQTYTVERLHAMKEEHERWVEKTLGSGLNLTNETLQKKTETIYSTLLPIERMPRFIFGIPTTARTEGEITNNLLPLRNHEMAPFILRQGMLFAFQNMNLPRNPFGNLVPGRSAERYLLSEWTQDPDHQLWLTQLLNRSLNKLTGRRGLFLDKEHRRYYFPAVAPGQEVSVTYRPLNQKSAQRKVVWRRRSIKTGQPRGYWYHRAISLSFMLTERDAWCLCLRPELRLTTDGVNPASSKRIGARVTREKSHRFNYDLLGEVNFWRDFLSEGRPRIIMSFGPNQSIFVSTTLLESQVIWPGIPEEYTKPFKNVNYVDDLFSWTELANADRESEDDEGNEDIEDSEDIEGEVNE